MPLRERTDRRGRTARGQSGLLERDDALRAIGHLLDAVADESGGALLIAGHAGLGKTRLHEAALDQGRARNLRVVRAAGAELERNVAHGVAGQLLRSLVSELSPSRRRSLLADSPERLRTLLRTDEQLSGPEPGEETLSISHGLFTVLAGLAEARPELVAIDDLHWCDEASLDFVLYMLHRVDELSLALVMSSRPGADGQSSESLDRVLAHPRVRIETLSPLGPDATDELVRRALGDRADASIVAVCREATSGNPFYLRELLLALAAEPGLGGAQLAERARGLAPDAVTRSLRVRVGRLGPEAGELARAVSILGDDVELRHAAALAGLPIAQAGAAADALAGVEVLLAREPLRFVHPLVRHAIERDIPASQRASRHLDAARLLYADGDGAELVAAHLLLGRAEGNPWVVEQLRAAAREARSRAAAQSTVRYLERAQAEPPPAELRGAVLAELGSAEALLGSPAAVEHLAAAAAASSDPLARAELALRRGRALATAGQHERACAAYEDGLRELADEPRDPAEQELRDQLQTAFVITAGIVPSLQQRALERAAQALAPAGEGPYTQGQRLLLAQAAARAAATGEPARGVIALAERAWDEGRLLEQANQQWIGWRTVASALCTSGALERCLEITDAALADARRHGWPLGFATASYIRGLPQLWQGRVGEALADLEHARDARRYGWREFGRSAAAHYTLCLIERGELDQAEAALSEDAPLAEPPDLEDVLRMHALAELRLAQGRPAEALELALSAGAVAESSSPFFGYCPWRVPATQAALALGDRARALELAEEILARADRTGVLHERIQGLRLVGICEGGAAGLEKLRAAVELGEASPPRLETIRALIELGAALRRAGKRAAARPPLQRAADSAKRGGASALHERARTELAATGARPRREALLSGPESLTASERRIAELAAAGNTNREIAQTLFVTPKTVEYHLRNAYRKLDISTRGELAGALG